MLFHFVFDFRFISLVGGGEQVTEYEAAERTNNQELQWVSHNEVQIDSLEPDKNQV